MSDHGTYSRYARGCCRCDVCATAQRERVARNRADRLAAGRLNHGTRSAYDAGCRCNDCKAARRAANQRDAAHRRATTQEGQPA